MHQSAAQFNKEASQTYQQLSAMERDNLRVEASKQQRLSQKEVLRRGEKIFKKIQQMVCNVTLRIHL